MALDFLKTLFGGSETQQQSSSTPTDVTPPEFSALRSPFASALQTQLQTGGPSYSGPLNAPIGANETSTLQQLMGQTGPNTARSGYLNNVLSGNYLPGGQNQNPFLESLIKSAQRPTFQGLEETLSRTLPGRFTQAGQFINPQGSSAFDRASAIAARGASDTAGDIATKLSAGAYDTERNLQQQAVPLSQAEVDTTVKNLQAQALPRLIQELGIERGLAEFQRRTSSILDLLKTIGGVTSPSIAQTSQSTGTSETSKGLLGPLSLGNLSK